MNASAASVISTNPGVLNNASIQWIPISITPDTTILHTTFLFLQNILKNLQNAYNTLFFHIVPAFILRTRLRYPTRNMIMV